MTDVREHALNSIGQADREHRLARVLEDVDDRLRRIFQEYVFAVGKQVILGSPSHSIDEALAEFALEEAHHLADSLKAEALAAQFANDGDFR